MSSDPESRIRESESFAQRRIMTRFNSKRSRMLASVRLSRASWVCVLSSGTGAKQVSVPGATAV